MHPRFFKDIREFAQTVYDYNEVDQSLFFYKAEEFDGEYITLKNHDPAFILDYQIHMEGVEFNTFGVHSVTFVKPYGKKKTKLHAVTLTIKSQHLRYVDVTFRPRKKVTFTAPGNDIYLEEAEEGNDIFTLKKVSQAGVANDMVVSGTSMLLQYDTLYEELHQSLNTSTQATPSSTSIVESPLTASTLFLFDRNLMNKVSYHTIKFQVVDAMRQVRLLMYNIGMKADEVNTWGYGTAYYRDYKGWNIYGYEPAPASLCPSGTCTTNYSQLMDRMSYNMEVANLRKKYNADMVMYIHEKPGVTSNGSAVFGLANTPLYPDTPISEAPRRVAVADYYAGYLTLTHEMLHLLGAGHARQNNDFTLPTGYNGYAFAFIGAQLVVPTHGYSYFRPYKTFMAYESTCEDYTNNGKSCHPINSLSTIRKDAKIGEYFYNIGSLENDNHWAIATMFPKSVQWSKFYNP